MHKRVVAVVTSDMESQKKNFKFAAVAVCLMSCCAMMACLTALGQSAPGGAKATPSNLPSLKDRLFGMISGGPGAWTPEQIQAMEKIRDLALTDPYALDQLRHLSNNIGPRLSGSPQAANAVNYVAAQMKALGAEVTLDKARVPHWVRGDERAELISWPGQPDGAKQKIVLTALGGSVATPAEGLTAPVVVIKDWAALKALPEGAAKGKILLFNHKFDEALAAEGFGMNAYGGAVSYRSAGPIAAAAVGAVAVLVRSAGGGIYRSPHTGMTMYPGEGVKVPAAAVTAEDAELISDLASQGPVVLHLTLTPQTLPDVESYNVIADWKGSEHPEQVVVVSGHLDSWDLGTGAIDDGAGVVVAMQTIHLLKELGIKPRRTVRMIAWMSEEEGSEGAAQYIKDYAAEVPNHIAAIESDLGAGHPVGIYYAGKPQLGQFLRPVAQVLEGFGSGQLISSPETGEDINVLTEKGVPSFAPVQDARTYFNYHHTAADTFDKVVPRELNENAAVMAVLAYALADSKDAAPR